MHIDSVSCGQGAPSLYLIVMAGERKIRADVVITADTGWELDCLWNTGERSTAKEFWERVTKPLANSYGIDAVFVRAQDREGNELPAIQDAQFLADGKVKIDIPMFGSRGGKLSQSCTEKWKKAAIRQELRRRKAKTATSALGLTMDEVHRMRAGDVQWERLYWPLIDARLYRASTVERLADMGIPYLVSTQCDGCPHKDLPRWQSTSPDVIRDLTEWERQFGGEFYITRNLKPLDVALVEMQKQESLSMFEPCDSGYCFV